MTSKIKMSMFRSAILAVTIFSLVVTQDPSPPSGCPATTVTPHIYKDSLVGTFKFNANISVNGENVENCVHYLIHPLNEDQKTSSFIKTQKIGKDYFPRIARVTLYPDRPAVAVFDDNGDETFFSFVKPREGVIILIFCDKYGIHYLVGAKNSEWVKYLDNVKIEQIKYTGVAYRNVTRERTRFHFGVNFTNCYFEQ